MAPHSSTLAWKIPWMEEPGRLQSMGSLRVGHYWVTSLSLSTFMHWRRKWQPTPVFLPGESQGWRSLVGCHLWGHTESDTTEATQQQQQQQFTLCISGHSYNSWTHGGCSSLCHPECIPAQRKGKRGGHVFLLRILTGKVACNLLTHTRKVDSVFSNIALSSDLVTTD